MAGVKFNSSFYKKLDMIVTMTSRKALSDLSKRTAHWGIKGHGDLPMIMGVLEFGDPAHTFPNAKKGTEKRKAVEKLIASGGQNESAIPPRPWLNKSRQGTYRSHLTKYVNNSLQEVLRSMPKTGNVFYTSHSKKLTDKFIQGLAEVGAQNARDSWNSGNFAKNAEATLINKDDPRPLHGNGGEKDSMSEDKITAWSE